jgi:hypothetical protein
MKSKSKLKLEQGQIWKQGALYYRIVKWTRLTIDYKVLKDPTEKEGTLHPVSKKEFCRLIKGATLLTPALLAADIAERDASPAPGEPALIDLTAEAEAVSTPETNPEAVAPIESI